MLDKFSKLLEDENNTVALSAYSALHEQILMSPLTLNRIVNFLENASSNDPTMFSMYKQTLAKLVRNCSLSSLIEFINSSQEKMKISATHMEILIFRLLAQKIPLYVYPEENFISVSTIGKIHFANKEYKEKFQELFSDVYFEITGIKGLFWKERDIKTEDDDTVDHASPVSYSIGSPRFYTNGQDKFTDQQIKEIEEYSLSLMQPDKK